MSKTKIFLCIIIFFCSQLYSSEKHVIGARRGAGFFSDFFAVLMHLAGCKQNNLVPVVYWDNKSSYYVTNSSCNNAWEYYFEPLSNVRCEKGDKIHRNFHFLGAPYIYARMPNYVRNFNYNFKKYMNNIMQEHIKIKRDIVNKIELFYETHMKGKKVIGIHVRRTNKIEESSLLDVNVFLKIASQFKECHIFIASDEHDVINKFKQAFPGRVIVYNAHRSSDSSPHYLGRDKKDPLNAVIGEEVLIETILLSKCDIFVHSVSNVSTAVLFFNPELKHIFIDPSMRFRVIKNF